MNVTALTVRSPSGQERYPLDHVRIVERTSRAHVTGAIVGAIAGFIYGTGLSEGSKVGGLVIAPLGARGGALIGAAAASTHRAGHVLYIR